MPYETTYSASDAHAADRFEWERVIRRITDCALPVKGFALILATYADKDGTNVHPGVERLAAVTQTSKRTVIRRLDGLREAGLIQRTQFGDRRRGKADVYRLTIPSDLLERFDLLPPSELQVSEL